MKKFISAIIALVLGVIAVGCTGPDGPQGAPGVPGPLTRVYEKKNVSFQSSQQDPKVSDSYAIEHPYDLGFGDAVMVFFLDGVEDGAPVWTPLPRRYDNLLINVNGQQKRSDLDYYYNLAPFYIDLFARGEDNLMYFDKVFGKNGSLSYIKGLTFRFVYILGEDPIQLKSTNSISSQPTMSYEEVVKKYNIKEEDVINL
ncbi:hypothetical protein [Myroides pelagicus]|uniref:Collagen-like protein n=1 Tax=Myroides pelagicus TaxID=270914 RepID=A0A7K1GH30_9FLAO|nr:hypothetical protein [Myroides pelagicus]MEC4113518.1 hypothetical protein [Myroides pelagicus]MTH28355.1 hypothetical protein [Myroides pelagicus]